MVELYDHFPGCRYFRAGKPSGTSRISRHKTLSITDQQRAEIPCNIPTVLCRMAGTLLRIGMLSTVCCSAVGQNKPDSPFSAKAYVNARLAFRYTPPKGMRDKTAQFGLHIQDQSGMARVLSALLAMSSGTDSDVPHMELDHHRDLSTECGFGAK